MRLSDLIDELVDMYKQSGDLDVRITTEGQVFPEIELSAEDDLLYLKGYQRGDAKPKNGKWIVGLRGGVCPKQWVALKKTPDHGIEIARDADENILYFNSPFEAAMAIRDGEISPEEWSRTVVAGSVGICKRCGSPLFYSFTEGYKYQCFNCDEDFFGFEQEGAQE